MTLEHYRPIRQPAPLCAARLGNDEPAPMKLSGLQLALAAFAALSPLTGARAQQAQVWLVSNDISNGGRGVAVTVPRRSMEWDSRKTRWGLKLGVEQHTDRDVQWKDVAPGVYYRLTPRLHIGGAVSLAPDELESQKLLDPQMPAPRVRLETTFKF